VKVNPNSDAKADPKEGPRFGAKTSPNSSVRAGRSFAARADLSSGVKAGPNSGLRARPVSIAKAGPSSGGKASQNFAVKASPNSDLRADQSSGARTMPAGHSSLEAKDLPSKSGRSRAGDSREIGKEVRLDSKAAPRQGRGARALAAQRETGKAVRARPSPRKAFPADPHSEAARQGLKGLVRGANLVEVLGRVARASGALELDDRTLRDRVPGTVRPPARVPGIQAVQGAQAARGLAELPG